MKIYVGRWDLLPESWEGYNGLSKASEKEIRDEIKFQQYALLQRTGYEDDFIGVYDEQEYLDTFNQCLARSIDSKDYWIKIF